MAAPELATPSQLQPQKRRPRHPGLPELTGVAFSLEDTLDKITPNDPSGPAINHPPRRDCAVSSTRRTASTIEALPAPPASIACHDVLTTQSDASDEDHSSFIEFEGMPALSRAAFQRLPPMLRCRVRRPREDGGLPQSSAPHRPLTLCCTGSGTEERAQQRERE